MSESFDVILGQDWCKQVGCNISFAKNLVTVSDLIGSRIDLIPQATDVDVLCPIVNAIDLEASLEDDDLLFMVHVTELSEVHITRADQAGVELRIMYLASLSMHVSSLCLIFTRTAFHLSYLPDHGRSYTTILMRAL